MKDPDSARLRIGVLPPNSNFISFLARDLLNAVKFGLAEADTEVELIAEFVGYNADLKAVLPKMQELLVVQQVAAVVAPFNVALLESLGSHFEQQCVPLIALNMEEDPYFETARNPFIFVNSFHLWQAAWMCGYLGAQRFGPRGAFMVAMHEGGYGLAFAFQLGMEAANGSLVNTAVTHRASSSEDPSPSIAAVAAAEPDFIWAGYSGKEAASFLAAYEASGYKDRIPVLGLPPLADDAVLKTAGSAAHGIYLMSAAPSLGRADLDQCPLERALGRLPNPYAVMGYESAHLLAAALRKSGTGGVSSLPEALREAVFEGPRGAVRFDNGVTELAFALRRLTPSSDSVEEIQAPPLLYEQQMLARKKLTKQGWINPYLCA